MIVDINSNAIDIRNLVFHFKRSLVRFIAADADCTSTVFIDIDNHICYNWEDLERCGYQFYRDKDNEDFCGVNTSWTEEPAEEVMKEYHIRIEKIFDQWIEAPDEATAWTIAESLFENEPEENYLEEVRD